MALVDRALLIVVAMACIGTPVEPVHATQVCVGCPTPKKTRITDGRWQTAITLGQGVTKSDAELIVRAARGNQITDRPIDEKFKNLPPLDIRTVDYIGDASSYFSGPDPWLGQAESNVRYFFLAVPSGSKNTSRAHIVAVREGRVERVALVECLA